MNNIPVYLAYTDSDNIGIELGFHKRDLNVNLLSVPKIGETIIVKRQCFSSDFLNEYSDIFIGYDEDDDQIILVIDDIVHHYEVKKPYIEASFRIEA